CSAPVPYEVVAANGTGTTITRASSALCTSPKIPEPGAAAAPGSNVVLIDCRTISQHGRNAGETCLLVTVKKRMAKIDSGDTAWLLTSAALVLLMTPALALFYAGMVRRKNVLSTIMHSLSAIPILSITWALFGYSLAFGPTKGGLIGGLDYAGLS